MNGGWLHRGGGQGGFTGSKRLVCHEGGDSCQPSPFPMVGSVHGVRASLMPNVGIVVVKESMPALRPGRL